MTALRQQLRELRRELFIRTLGMESFAPRQSRRAMGGKFWERKLKR